MTLTDKVVEHLKACGAKEVKSRSTKYRCFKTSQRTYWVGKMGAVRAGKTVGESISISGMVHAAMKRKEDNNGSKSTLRQESSQG